MYHNYKLAFELNTVVRRLESWLSLRTKCGTTGNRSGSKSAMEAIEGPESWLGD